jgi:hypothetical protein
MGIIAWIVVGLIAGALGKLIMPGDDPGGIIVNDPHRGSRRVHRGLPDEPAGFRRGDGVQRLVDPSSNLGRIILLAIYRAVVGGRTT